MASNTDTLPRHSLPRKLRHARPMSSGEFAERIASTKLGDKAKALLASDEGSDSPRALRLLHAINMRAAAAADPAELLTVTRDDLKELAGTTHAKAIRRLDCALNHASSGRYRLKVLRDLRDKALAERLDRSARDLGIRRDKDCPPFFLVENVDQAPKMLRVGFLNYPPFSGVEDGRPIGIYGDLFNALKAELGFDSEVVPTGLAAALDDLERADDDPERLDCLFGVFETPKRARRNLGRHFLTCHLVALVGVTRKDSDIGDLSDVTKNGDVAVYCVRDEVGDEFVQEVLDLRPDKPPRVTRLDCDPLTELLAALDARTEPGPAIAFLDGISVTRYTRLRKTRKKGRSLEIRLPPLMWYPNGILLREALFESIGDEWLTTLRRLRAERYDTFEANAIADFEDVVVSILSAPRKNAGH